MGKKKTKTYLPDCIFEKPKWRPVLLIIRNECLFFTGSGIEKTWIGEKKIFLWSKIQGMDIMIFRFIFSFSRLN